MSHLFIAIEIIRFCLEKSNFRQNRSVKGLPDLPACSLILNLSIILIAIMQPLAWFVLAHMYEGTITPFCHTLPLGNACAKWRACLWILMGMRPSKCTSAKTWHCPIVIAIIAKLSCKNVINFLQILIQWYDTMIQWF